MRQLGAVLSGLVLMFSGAGFLFPAAPPDQAGSGLLPGPDGWALTESQEYVPDNLFEYIDGAAENYLSYDFARLTLGQYKEKDGPGEMTVEIYDMGTAENAFGVYSTERVPGSAFIPVGVQGYLEDGVLNFFAGRFYVKLLAYDAGERTEAALRAFAAGILKGIPEPGTFPRPVRAFPAEGRVADSEKFILRDFLGLAFLSRGYTAVYRLGDGGEFNLFVIDALDEAGAARTFGEMTAHFGAAAGAADSAVRFKDPYLGTVIVVPAGRYLCGATKLDDGTEKQGQTLVLETAGALRGK